MAEAYSAVRTNVVTNAHKQKCDPFSHELQLAVSDEGFMLFVPHPRFLARSAVRRMYRFSNKFKDLLWPLGPSLTVVIVAFFVYLVVQSPADSWLRSGPIAGFFWEVDKWFLLSLPVAPSTRVAYLSVIVAVLFLLGLMMVQRLFLRFLLQYTRWAYETR